MLFVTGDVHYPLDAEKLFFLNEYLTSSDTVIVSGDMGLAWDTQKRTTDCINELMYKTKYNILFIDGNHEHFPILNAYPTVDLYGGKAGKLTDRLYHLYRGEEYCIEGKTFLTFGGARSLDRGLRIDGEDWFAEEEATITECNKFLEQFYTTRTYDYVITHDAPKFITDMLHPFDIEHPKSCTQQMLDELVKHISCKHWFFGHHHTDRVFDGTSFVCLYNSVFCLDTDKFFAVADDRYTIKKV